MSSTQSPERQRQTHSGEEPSASGIPERDRRLLETTPLIPWEADATSWRFTYVGPQAVRVLGYPREEWYEKDFWTAHLHSEDREYAIDFCVTSSRQGKDYDFKYRMVGAAGQIVWIHDFVSVDSVDGKPKTLRGFLMDVTHHEQAREKLKTSEDRFRRLLEAAPDPIVLERQDGTIALVNSQTERVFGYDREELMGQAVETLVPERFRLKPVKQRGEYSSNPTIRPMGADLDLFGRRKDGTEFPVEISLSPFHYEQKKYVLSSIRDVSERKQMELRLRGALAEVTELRDQLEAENVYLREEIKSEHNFDGIVGNSDPLRSVLRMVEHVASTDATVLILGETGTGKELVARAIHSRSSRSNHPLVKVNCATLPSGIVESELFGHEKGAFTGAVGQRVGRFELADGGTIFLDEIGELAPETQAKLLRVLEEGQFEPVGSSETLKVNVRIIAASNRNLEGAIKDGIFRRDLYYRLKVFPVELPPLRERREDIPLLVWHFVTINQRALGKKINKVPKRIMNALQAYDWPGNVRELEHVIQRAMILSPDSTLTLAEVLRGEGTGEDAASASLSLREAERAHIVGVMEQCRWKLKGKGNAADRLGLHPSTLRSRMAKLGIERPSLNS